jgi:hypothetical protein
MQKICPKCYHVRSEFDDLLIPDDTCPSCGVIYAKFKNKQIIAPAKAPKQTPTPVSDTPSKEHAEFVSGAKRKFLGIVKFVILTMLIIVWFGAAKSFGALITWLFLGPMVGAAAAQQRGMNMATCILGGFLIGPFSLYLFMVDGSRERCPACAEWIQKKAKLCPHCKSTARRSD